MDEEGTLTVITCDDTKVTVSIKLCQCSELIKSIVDDIGADDAIRLARVTDRALQKIITFYEAHEYISPAELEKPLKADFNAILREANRTADLEFTEGLIDDLPFLGELLTATDYLDCKGYLSLLCGYIANFFRGKEWLQIKDLFELEGEFDFAAKEQLKEEFPWLDAKEAEKQE